MNERVYIKEASLKVGLKDRRSFCRWSKLQKLTVRKDKNCKKLYVFRNELMEVVNSNNCENKTTSEEISSKIKMTSQILTAVNNNGFKKCINSYTPKYSHELGFLASLTAIIKRNNNRNDG